LVNIVGRRLRFGCGFWAAVGCAGSLFFPSCKREPALPARADAAQPAERPRAMVHFPDGLALDDPSVREFVSEAIKTCSTGTYEDFRLLWSARENPLSREEYEKSWRAVQTIRVRALEKALLSGDPEKPDEQPEDVYALFAEVALDPSQPIGQRKSSREIVLMLVREHGRWRFAQAPKPMREWIRGKAGAKDSPEEQADSK